MDDREAIIRLRGGHIDALDALVERHQAKALRVAYLIVGDARLAEDAVQDAFIRVMRSAKRFDLARPFEPWLMQIVVNRAITSAKRSSRDVSLDDVPQAATDWAARLRDPAAGPEDALLLTESQGLIQEALTLLTPAERAVVVQRYYLGLTHAEIASRSDRAVGTVKHLMFRAHRRLRTILSAPAPAPTNARTEASPDDRR